MSKSTIAVVLSIVAFAFSPRAVVAQHDVHAALIAKADRKVAPAFHLADANGKTVQISDFRGKVVLLNFWATACGGCVLEIPSFVALQQKYGNTRFTAVGISADISYDGLKTPMKHGKRCAPSSPGTRSTTQSSWETTPYSVPTDLTSTPQPI